MNLFKKAFCTPRKIFFQKKEKDIPKKNKKGKSEYFDANGIEYIIKNSKNKGRTNNIFDKALGRNYSLDKKGIKRRNDSCSEMIPKLDVGLPFTMICKIFYRNRGEIERESTGFFISPKVVITVAHELYHGNQYFEDAIIVPCIEIINGEFKYPLGGVVADKFIISEGYTNGRGEGNDYGAIFFDEEYFIDSINSYFNLYSMNQEGNRLSVYIAGYPDTSLLGDVSISHLKYAEATAMIDDSGLKHNFNPEGGQSGMPIWIEEGQKYYVIGINDSDCDLPQIKLTNEVISELNNWIEISY
ncbi:trypsin-like serine peptidase [Kordia sp.]|uniref:trypsin-like serine peptidase n=1 Tax=Kordia sp. TaxID=1965332 RepID=UPI003D6C2459